MILGEVMHQMMFCMSQGIELTCYLESFQDTKYTEHNKKVIMGYK